MTCQKYVLLYHFIYFKALFSQIADSAAFEVYVKTKQKMQVVTTYNSYDKHLLQYVL